MPRHVRVVIIGAGFAGLGMAAQLSRHGIDDFVLIERGDDVGGTWRDNTYPGAACDIRSDLYSFSFAPNPDWTRSYGRQPEILDYLRGIADRFDLRGRIQFGTELDHATWNESERRWEIATRATGAVGEGAGDGVFTADILISGAGPLIEPVWPDIPGLDSFEGSLFHSARWNHDVALAGKRVAVIGTGASAIQFVPEVRAIADRVTVFQRTPAWIIPRRDRPTTALRRRVFRRAPVLQRLARAMAFRSAEVRFAGFRFAGVGALFEFMPRVFLRREVKDPVLRDKLTPRYRIGCKRILVSSDFYRAVTAGNVELETNAIEKIDGDEIVTADGRRERFDVLIAGTGFDATRPPIARHITGTGGRLLADAWAPHMAALRGTTVAGFPNLFLLVGPNTALGHNSIIYIIEAQVGYILDALGVMDARRATTLEPRPAAQERYNGVLQSALSRSVWSIGGCSSYYLDTAGRNTALWPHRAAKFRHTLRRFDSAEYELG